MRIDELRDLAIWIRRIRPSAHRQLLQHAIDVKWIDWAMDYAVAATPFLVDILETWKDI